MWKEIGIVFRHFGALEYDCRCILLTGEGESFCAGIDVFDDSFGLIEFNDSQGKDFARQFLSFRPKIIEMQQCLSAIEECSIPVVVAIHGSCIGGGIDLTCCADVRISSPSAKFSIREVQLGLAADVGTLQRFPKIVGHGSRVRELCFTGEDFNAQESAMIGFISRISKSDETLFDEALCICRRIAKNSPVAVTGTKMSLNYSRDHSVRDGLENIAMHNAAALMTNDLVVAFSNRNGAAKFDSLIPHSKL